MPLGLCFMTRGFFLMLLQYCHQSFVHWPITYWHILFELQLRNVFVCRATGIIILSWKNLDASALMPLHSLVHRVILNIPPITLVNSTFRWKDAMVVTGLILRKLLHSTKTQSPTPVWLWWPSTYWPGFRINIPTNHVVINTISSRTNDFNYVIRICMSIFNGTIQPCSFEATRTVLCFLSHAFQVDISGLRSSAACEQGVRRHLSMKAFFFWCHQLRRWSLGWNSEHDSVNAPSEYPYREKWLAGAAERDLNRIFLSYFPSPQMKTRETQSQVICIMHSWGIRTEVQQLSASQSCDFFPRSKPLYKHPGCQIPLILHKGFFCYAQKILWPEE